MNPDLDPSINDAKWNEIIDGTKTPNLCVQKWMSEWKDGSGDIVEYIFRYEYPMPDKLPPCGRDTSILTDLQVVSVFWSASRGQIDRASCRAMGERTGVHQTGWGSALPGRYCNLRFHNSVAIENLRFSRKPPFIRKR